MYYCQITQNKKYHQIIHLNILMIEIYLFCSRIKHHMYERTFALFIYLSAKIYCVCDVFNLFMCQLNIQNSIF